MFFSKIVVLGAVVARKNLVTQNAAESTGFRRKRNSVSRVRRFLSNIVALHGAFVLYFTVQDTLPGAPVLQTNQNPKTDSLEHILLIGAFY